jgi:hypothetical protein
VRALPKLGSTRLLPHAGPYSGNAFTLVLYKKQIHHSKLLHSRMQSLALQ